MNRRPWHAVGPQTADTQRRRLLRFVLLAPATLAMLPAAEAWATQTGASDAAAAPDPLASIHLQADGQVVIEVGKLEMGQGATTGLAQLVAEEMDADWQQVRVVSGPAAARYIDPRVGMQVTGGSHSIRHQWDSHRELGARMRWLLVQAAAQHWGAPPQHLSTERGHVRWGEKSLPYHTLRDRLPAMRLPAQVRLKPPGAHRLIGRPLPRLDAPGKICGATRYGIDHGAGECLVAVIARPERFGAVVRRWAWAPGVPPQGVLAAFEIPLTPRGSGVAVVAADTASALRARSALSIDWTLPDGEAADSEALTTAWMTLADQPGLVAPGRDLPLRAETARTTELTWVFPYLAHLAMEPLNATVWLEEDRVQVWTGTQFQTVDQEAIARTCGLPASRVALHTLPAGGGFGRRATADSDVVVQACRVAIAARLRGLNAPVKLMWTREDDTRAGYYRPLHVHRARLQFDAQGRLLLWHHRIVGQSLLQGTPFEAGIGPSGVDTASTEGLADTAYNLPLRLEVHHPRCEVPVLWWRAVGHNHTAFVVETLVDELARQGGRDPAALRMTLLPHGHRARDALQLALRQAAWGRPLPAGQAQGIAVHTSFGTAVAMVARVSLRDREVRVHEVVAGVHAGYVVNPSSARAQIEGAIVMALGTLLPGSALLVRQGAAVQSGLHDLRLPRMADTPRVRVHFVASEEAPGGLGEPGLPPLGPAVANALARLTGKHWHHPPFQA